MSEGGICETVGGIPFIEIADHPDRRTNIRGHHAPNSFLLRAVNGRLRLFAPKRKPRDRAPSSV
jgi:hypothetical protein